MRSIRWSVRPQGEDYRNENDPKAWKHRWFVVAEPDDYTRRMFRFENLEGEYKRGTILDSENVHCPLTTYAVHVTGYVYNTSWGDRRAVGEVVAVNRAAVEAILKKGGNLGYDTFSISMEETPKNYCGGPINTVKAW